MSAYSFGSSPSAFCTSATAARGRLVHVANGGDAAVRIERRVVVDVVAAAASQADNADVDPVVGAENRERRRSDRRSRSVLIKLPSAFVYLHGP